MGSGEEGGRGEERGADGKVGKREGWWGLGKRIK